MSTRDELIFRLRELADALEKTDEPCVALLMLSSRESSTCLRLVPENAPSAYVYLALGMLAEQQVAFSMELAEPPPSEEL